MPKNVGGFDRLLRIVVALAILLAWSMGWISGTVALVLGIVAVIFALTAAVSFCPLYKVIGTSTCRTP